MRYVKKDDWFEIRLASVLSDYDRQILNILYQPLIGYSSLALYFTLWAESNHNNYHDLASHERLFNFMQITPGDFLKARQRLEAVGLLETYFKSENGVDYYTYLLKSPKYPNDFFDDPLFAGLYEKYLGVKEAEKIARSFEINIQSLTQDKERISASFPEVYHPDFDDDMFVRASNLSKGDKSQRVAGDVRAQFDFGTFFSTMKERYGISEKYFKKKDRKRIEGMAILFGFDGERMAEIVNRTYTASEDGKAYFNLDLLKQYCQEDIKFPSIQTLKATKSALTSDSEMAKEIHLMDALSPTDYLIRKQNNRQLVSSDFALLERLVMKLGLPGPVINALVYYVLDTNDQKLPASLTEKIGASLMRSKITNALDAINYLYKSRYQRKDRIEEDNDEIEDIESQEEPEQEENQPTTTKEEDEADMMRIRAMFSRK